MTEHPRGRLEAGVARLCCWACAALRRGGERAWSRAGANRGAWASTRPRSEDCPRAVGTARRRPGRPGHHVCRDRGEEKKCPHPATRSAGPRKSPEAEGSQSPVHHSTCCTWGASLHLLHPGWDEEAPRSRELTLWGRACSSPWATGENSRSEVKCSTVLSLGRGWRRL